MVSSPSPITLRKHMDKDTSATATSTTTTTMTTEASHPSPTQHRVSVEALPTEARLRQKERLKEEKEAGKKPKKKQNGLLLKPISVLPNWLSRAN